jgi:hypothetical protein
MSCCPLDIITLSTQTDIKAEEVGSRIERNGNKILKLKKEENFAIKKLKKIKLTQIRTHRHTFIILYIFFYKVSGRFSFMQKFEKILLSRKSSRLNVTSVDLINMQNVSQTFFVDLKQHGIPKLKILIY